MDTFLVVLGIVIAALLGIPFIVLIGGKVEKKVERKKDWLEEAYLNAREPIRTLRR